jgi:NAD(P)-dependent dehydrogenase (short-subunit alcohol dehydrogenase family)
MNLEDPVAVVTGASGGIGAVAAHRLAEAGARVIA